MEEHTISACQSKPFSWILEENEEPDIIIEYKRLGGKLRDRVFLTCILLEKSSADIQATATTFQRLSETFQKSTAADKKLLSLLSYIQGCCNNY